jgi:radical SAM-linked protein
LKVRYLIKFSKENEIKFVGHLDLMRTIQRMMKRSGLPVAYSQGFNPHINLSLAQPLAVGIYSSGDYFDAPLEEDVPELKVKEALNQSAPPGIRIFEVVKIKEEDDHQKVFKSMAVIDAAKYTIRIRYKNTDLLNEEMKTLFEMKEWNIVKKSKRQEKEVDIRTMIKDIEYKVVEKILVIEAVVSCGSRENLSPELIAQFVKIHTTNWDSEAFTDIKRQEMYAALENKLIPLYKFVKMR